MEATSQIIADFGTRDMALTITHDTTLAIVVKPTEHLTLALDLHSGSVHLIALLAGGTLDATLLHARPGTHSTLRALAITDTSASIHLQTSVPLSTADCSAHQHIRGIALSGTAHIDALPVMRIADSSILQATHSLSLGALPPEEIEALRLRGLTEDASRALLIQGSIVSEINRLPDELQKAYSTLTEELWKH